MRVETLENLRFAELAVHFTLQPGLQSRVWSAHRADRPARSISPPAEIAEAAWVSKPLQYDFFATKSAVYFAPVEWAADELRTATQPDPSLPAGQRIRGALDAHLDWIDTHALAYRAIIQGGISSVDQVQIITAGYFLAHVSVNSANRSRAAGSVDAV